MRTHPEAEVNRGPCACRRSVNRRTLPAARGLRWQHLVIDPIVPLGLAIVLNRPEPEQERSTSWVSQGITIPPALEANPSPVYGNTPLPRSERVDPTIGTVLEMTYVDIHGHPTWISRDRER